MLAHDVLIVVAKAVIGGAMVVLFTALGHVLRPRWFAGLFGAAPAVTLGSLSVTILDQGLTAASWAADGMVFGALGFVAFAVCARPLMSRVHAAVASALACGVWTVIALGTYQLATRA